MSSSHQSRHDQSGYTQKIHLGFWWIQQFLWFLVLDWSSMDVLLQVGKDGELQSSGVDHEIVKFVC